MVKYRLKAYYQISIYIPTEEMMVGIKNRVEELKLRGASEYVQRLIAKDLEEAEKEKKKKAAA